MQIEVKIDHSCIEPKIVIFTAEMTEEIKEMVQKLSEKSHKIISGSKDGKIAVLEQDDLFKIYAENGRVLAAAADGEYVLRLRLYEAEERLNPHQFVRISNSEIVNLRKVKNFDLSFSGTICVELEDNTATYVSRRYVSKIKKILGI